MKIFLISENVWLGCKGEEEDSLNVVAGCEGGDISSDGPVVREVESEGLKGGCVW